MPTREEALASLTDIQRQALGNDPELSAAFNTQIQREIDAIKPVGVSWGGLTRDLDFDPARTFSRVVRDLGYARAQAILAEQDRRVMVVLTAAAGLRVETDLDTLCNDWGVGSEERACIRQAIATGQTYRGDYSGWSKFRREHTICAAEAVQVAA